MDLNGQLYNEQKNLFAFLINYLFQAVIACIVFTPFETNAKPLSFKFCAAMVKMYIVWKKKKKKIIKHLIYYSSSPNTNIASHMVQSC